MDPASGLPTKLARRKVHVVYYLNRGGGHVDHPHLIEGLLLPTQDGLHLKDFKNWLAVLRGKGMPNSFSWSYKRSYKSGYIWHDLSDNDLIHPLQKNEYVLMGSEIRNGYQDSCKSGYSKVQSELVGKRQSSKEDSKVLQERGIDYNSSSKASPKKAAGLAEAMKTDEYLHIRLSSPNLPEENMVSRAFSDCDQMDSGLASDGVLSPLAKPMVSMMSKPDLAQKSEVQEVKVYKAMAAEKVTDAATQTGESKRCSTEEALPLPLQLSSFLADAKRSSSSSLVDYNNNSVVGNIKLGTARPARAQDYYSNNLSSSAVSNKSETLYSPSSMHSSTVLETASPGSARSLRSINSINSTRLGCQSDQHPHTVAPSSKAKLCSSSQLVKQLLSCGTVDINESNILNLKSFSLHPPSSLATGNDQHHQQQQQHHQHQHVMSPPHVRDGQDPNSPPRGKSWLCRPCRHSCFTPDNRSTSALSMEGSLKDVVMASSPDSLVSKKSFPFLHISPPLINLNCSSSPKARSIGDSINNATKRYLQMGLNSFQEASTDRLISRSLSGGYRDFSSLGIQAENTAAAASHRFHDHPCKMSVDHIPTLDALIMSNSSTRTAFKRPPSPRNGSVCSYSSDSNYASEDQRVLCRERSPPNLYELVKSGSKRV